MIRHVRFPLPAILLALSTALSALLSTVSARAQLQNPVNTALMPSDQLPGNLKDVGVDQKLGKSIPLELEFQDERGQPVRLADVSAGKPVVLTLAYYKCPGLCTLVLTGVADALKQISPLLGKDYRALTVSISPKEGPPLALAKKRS